MSEPELDILHRLLRRLARLAQSASEDLALLGDVPDDLDAFEAMEAQRRSAARAFLKSFEQMEDQLARAFRVVPVLLGEDSSRWFSRDHADLMERFGVLDDAADWTPVVKLRNLLVHDYPLEEQVQFDRFRQAIGFLPLLRETLTRMDGFVRDSLPRLLA